MLSVLGAKGGDPWKPSGEKETAFDQMSLSHPLSIDVEKAVEAAGSHSRGDNALNVVPVDFDGDSSLLEGLGSLLGSFGFHFLQALKQGFGLADGERGHGDYCDGGVAPGLHYYNTLPQG